jgi:hypothetical protein
MTQYLISFGAHAMDHVPDEDAPAVARAARAAVQEAINKIAVACRCAQEVRAIGADPAPSPGRENPAGRRAAGLRPPALAGSLAASWLWGFCGDLENRGRSLRHGTL